MNLKIKIYLLLLFYLAIAEGAFIEIPTSQTVSIGETAEFRCRHATADTIRWRVNGTLVSISRHPVDITPGSVIEGDVLVITLTITGRPEFNGTEVICVARFDDGSPEETTNPEAVLIVSMDVTDNITSQTGFIEEPLSLNVTIGEEAVFRCEHRSADAISWRINGTSLMDRTELLSNFNDENFGRFHTLTVTALPEYNTTVVQCVAVFVSGNSQSEATAPAVLQIQGSLNRVDSIVRNFTTLSWSPPFSLDLSNVEPDIAYFVDVYNITCGGRELLISDCDVTETSYTSDVIAPDGYIYEYIVTPRSNVEGALNGTPSQPLRDNLPTFTESSARLSVGNFGQDSNVRAYQIELIYSFNNPIPSTYSLSLQSLDGLEDMDHVETTATIEPSVLTLEVAPGLPFRRLWNCTVLAFGCQGNNILNEELSTHDFRDILSSSLHPGEVRVTGSFTDDSTATGVLVIVIGDSEVIYHKASRDGTDKIKETLITGLAGGEYRISVFVLEENGLPFERVATSPKLVAVETNDVLTPPSSSIEYSLQSTSTGVCITCTFLDSSATDCVAVVHQRISQLSSSGLMNIESSHKLTRSGDTASGCIEGVNMEDYQVGVVGGTQVQTTVVSEQIECTTACVAAIIVIILFLVASVGVILIIFCIKRTKQGVVSYTAKDAGDVERERVKNVYVQLSSSDRPTNSHEDLYRLLSPNASKWLALGKALSLDKVLLDEISTNNETDEACLHVMLELYMKRPDYSWEKIDEARKKVEERGGETEIPELAPPLSEYGQVTIEMENTDEHLEISHDEGIEPAELLEGKDLPGSEENLSLSDTEAERNVTVTASTPKSSATRSQDANISMSPIPFHLDHGENKGFTVPETHGSISPVPAPVNDDTLLRLLEPLSDKWRDLGQAFSFDEQQLNKMSTKTEINDKDRLRMLINSYIVKPGCSWQKVVEALKMIQEDAIACRIYDLHVKPYASGLQEIHEQNENSVEVEPEKTAAEECGHPVQVEGGNFCENDIAVGKNEIIPLSSSHGCLKGMTFIPEGRHHCDDDDRSQLSLTQHNTSSTKSGGEDSTKCDSGYVSFSVDASKQDSASVEANSDPSDGVVDDHEGLIMKIKPREQFVFPGRTVSKVSSVGDNLTQHENSMTPPCDDDERAQCTSFYWSPT